MKQWSVFCLFFTPWGAVGINRKRYKAWTTLRMSAWRGEERVRARKIKVRVMMEGKKEAFERVECQRGSGLTRKCRIRAEKRIWEAREKKKNMVEVEKVWSHGNETHTHNLSIFYMKSNKKRHKEKKSLVSTFVFCPVIGLLPYCLHHPECLRDTEHFKPAFLILKAHSALEGY